MARKIIYVLVSIGILIMAFMFSSFLIHSKPEPPQDKTQKTVLQVKSSTIIYSEHVVTFKRRGRVYSYEQLPLSSQVGGKIEAGSVPLKTGASFKKGDVLFKIYNEDFKAALRSQRSSFVQSLAGILPDLKIDYPNDYEIWQSFFSSIKIDEPLPELPQITSESLKVFLASRGTLTSYYTIQQSEITLNKYQVFAPFDGTYQNVQMLPGSVINPGTLVGTLLRTDKLEVVVPVDAEYTKWLSSGDKVALFTKQYNQAVGTINRISQFVDAGTQTLNVYVQVDYPETKGLYSGNYVTVEFTGNKKAEGMLFPREALLQNNEVYVIQNNRLAKQVVDVVVEMDDQVLIHGLEKETVVVTESVVDAKIGDDVKPIS